MANPTVPAAEERSKTSTYFPVLRRMQSRRRDKENAQSLVQPSPAHPATPSTSQAPSTSAHPSSFSSGLRLPRNRRSMSQPPPIPRVIRSATDRLRSHHASPSSPPPVPSNNLQSPPGHLTSASASVSPISHLRHNNQTVADLSLVADNTLMASTNNSSPSGAQDSTPQLYSVRLVPHLDATRSLHFEPIERKIPISTSLKIGRFTDRSLPNGSPDLSDNRIAFKSKVVSRGHADIFTDPNGNFFIKDTKSSSGTFLNHIRLSAPGGESKPFPLRDGDVLQLGVDYQGGTEEIYRCVKMRVELNRGWQRAANNFK